jgi:hypothetical protein
MDEPATILALPAGVLPPLVQPCRVWACRAINQDFFWFFHVDAREEDFDALFAYGATFAPPLFTSVGWNQDHLLVHTNALYVGDESDAVKRFARPLLALVQYYATLRRLAQQLPDLPRWESPEAPDAEAAAPRGADP